MAQIWRTLKPGGILVIETGTSDSLGARLLRAGWYYLSYLEHFQAFSNQSLSHLLRQYGFWVSLKRRVYRSGVRSLYGSVYHTLMLPLYVIVTLFGRKARLWRYINSICLFRIVMPITGVFEKDHLFVVAQKPE